MPQIKCSLCLNFLHKNCTMLTHIEFIGLSPTQIRDWSCRICNETLFAFNSIDDDDDLFQRCLLDMNLDNINLSIVRSRNLILNPFDLNEDSDDIPLTDLDPDLQFYNNMQHILYNNSDYFDECSFNKSVVKKFNNKNTFSLFHLNIRSLPANLSNMLCYLDNLQFDFDIIGISENWLTDDNKNLYSINNYDHICNNRTDQIGGGVSLFIASHIKFEKLTEYTINNEHLECIFIEAEIDSSKKVIGIIYRPPNSNVDTFTSLLNGILESLR